LVKDPDMNSELPAKSWSLVHGVEPSSCFISSTDGAAPQLALYAAEALFIAVSWEAVMLASSTLSSCLSDVPNNESAVISLSLRITKSISSGGPLRGRRPPPPPTDSTDNKNSINVVDEPLELLVEVDDDDDPPM
jgi:hypothetical protein